MSNHRRWWWCSISRILWLLALIPVAVSVMCFSNTVRNSVDEECGPNGYCYTHNSSGRTGTYYRIIRGCDHSFLCETMISKINDKQDTDKKGSEKTIYNTLFWCTEDVRIRLEDEALVNGEICCCKESWCNKMFVDEMKSDLETIRELDNGTAIEYEILKTIAAKYGVK
ncbi:unnamed protein product [Gongylonema pulchrum]|uniref:Activin_recp domain-containing protein n=1 Tax=Gongylonema pulchrum TaxID=637853 RepID=A0A183EZY1_9BILA|nr:unnamed protein product [Gongylonema pulchrum]